MSQALSPSRSFFAYPTAERQRSLVELEHKVRAMRATLSPSTQALLDQWIEWAVSGAGR